MVEKSKKHMTHILIGNPGVGKSTILNGLLRGPAFESGISLGKGLTSILHRKVDEFGNVFIDTPGLSDIKMRKQAANEIVTALRFGGLFKVFFVITLEEGRIRPDDKTTMSLVLNAATDIKNSYSIVINKVNAEVKALLDDSEQRKEFLALLNEDLPGTQSIFVNSADPKLSGKKNQVPELTSELLGFLKDAPVVHIAKENVNEIKADSFEALKEMMSKQMEALQNDRKLMEQRLATQEAQFQQMIKDQQERDKQHSEEIKLYRDQVEGFQSQFMELSQKHHASEMAFRDKQLQHEKEMNEYKRQAEETQRLILQKQLELQNADSEKQRQHDLEIQRMREEQHQKELAMKEREHELELEAEQARSYQPEPSGGGGCFAYGSQLLKKVRDHQENCSIEEISIGDEVLTYDENGKLFWDTVGLVDENREAQQMRVQMVQIAIEGMESTPLLLTHHHYVFVLVDNLRKKILARDLRVGDDVIIFNPSEEESLMRKVVSTHSPLAVCPVKNIITAHTRSVLVNHILCSVHCEGDWGETYFKLGYFLWKYVSKNTPQLMFQFHKWMKSSLKIQAAAEIQKQKNFVN